MSDITIEDIERFRGDALAARDYESAAVCSIALGDNGEDVLTLSPPSVTDYARVNEIAAYQEDAWDAVSQWIFSARAMEGRP